jgi:hypothetical protein
MDLFLVAISQKIIFNHFGTKKQINHFKPFWKLPLAILFAMPRYTFMQIWGTVL